MKISVIGLGWFGEDLALELKNDGHEVSGTTTTPSKQLRLKKEGINTYLLSYPEFPSQELLETDCIILNIPPFSEELTWFKKWPWNKKCWVIFISSTSGSLIDQEEWVKAAFPNWTILRFGGLLGKNRHPGKSLSGKKNLPGRKWPVNLLHLSDAIGFTKKVLELGLKSKSFNVLSGDHPTREDFYQDYCQKMGLPLPEFDPSDVSLKDPICNQEAASYYQFHRNISE